eukprot:SM000105S13898  [mRNA]  locus=s105:317054:324092:+ [translate_table: standard]
MELFRTPRASIRTSRTAQRAGPAATRLGGAKVGEWPRAASSAAPPRELVAPPGNDVLIVVGAAAVAHACDHVGADSRVVRVGGDGGAEGARDGVGEGVAAGVDEQRGARRGARLRSEHRGAKGLAQQREDDAPAGGRRAGDDDDAAIRRAAVHGKRTFTSGDALPDVAQAREAFCAAHPSYAESEESGAATLREYGTTGRAPEKARFTALGLAVAPGAKQALVATAVELPGHPSASTAEATLGIVQRARSPSDAGCHLPAPALLQAIQEGRSGVESMRSAQSVLRFLQASEREYCAHLTSSTREAFQMIGHLYRFRRGTRLVAAYDHADGNVQALEHKARLAGAEVASPRFSWPSLQASRRDLSRLLRGGEAEAFDAEMEWPLDSSLSRGLFVAPVQSAASGAQFNMKWILEAKAQQWATVVDATAVVPGRSLEIGLLLPDFVVLSLHEVCGGDSGTFGCLLFRREQSYPMGLPAQPRERLPVELQARRPLWRQGVSCKASLLDFDRPPSQTADDLDDSESGPSSPMSASSSTSIFGEGLGSSCSLRSAIAASSSVSGDSTPCPMSPRRSTNTLVESRSTAADSTESHTEAPCWPLSPSGPIIRAEAGKSGNIVHMTEREQIRGESCMARTLGSSALADIRLLQPQSDPALQRRVTVLMDWLLASLQKLHHPGIESERLVRIYGPPTSRGRGAVLAFNIIDWKWDCISPALVQSLARQAGICVSTAKVRRWRTGDGEGNASHAGLVKKEPSPASATGFTHKEPARRRLSLSNLVHTIARHGKQQPGCGPQDKGMHAMAPSRPVVMSEKILAANYPAGPLRRTTETAAAAMNEQRESSRRRSISDIIRSVAGHRATNSVAARRDDDAASSLATSQQLTEDSVSVNIDNVQCCNQPARTAGQRRLSFSSIIRAVAGSTEEGTSKRGNMHPRRSSSEPKLARADDRASEDTASVLAAKHSLVSKWMATQAAESQSDSLVERDPWGELHTRGLAAAASLAKAETPSAFKTVPVVSVTIGPFTTFGDIFCLWSFIAGFLDDEFVHAKSQQFSKGAV